MKYNNLNFIKVQKIYLIYYNRIINMIYYYNNYLQHNNKNKFNKLFNN